MTPGEIEHTRDDGKFTAQVSQANLRYVEVVDTNTALCCFHETEEGQSERTLATSCSAEDADLLAGVDGERNAMQHVRKVGLKAHAGLVRRSASSFDVTHRVSYDKIFAFDGS